MTWWQWLLICVLPYLFIGIQLGKANEWIYQKIYNLRNYNDPYTHWYEVVIATVLSPFMGNDLLHRIFELSPKRRCVYDDCSCTEREYYAIKAVSGLPWHCAKLGFAVIVICGYAIYRVFLLLIHPLWKTKETLAALQSGVRYFRSKFKRTDQAVQKVAAAEPATEPCRALTTEEQITELEQRIAQSPDGQLLAELRIRLMREQEGAIPYRGAPVNPRVADTHLRVNRAVEDTEGDDEPAHATPEEVTVSTTCV